MTLKDFTECYAVPGQNSIIDGINPDTGLTCIFAKTEAQVIAENPAAVRMTYADWLKAAIDRQQTAITWEATTAEQFDDMLNVLPPAMMIGAAFLVGEPADHAFNTGAPRFDAYRQKGDRYFHASRPLTRAEFRAEMQS